MIAAYRFLSAAADELAESLAYYNDISPSLSQSFLRDLDRGIDLLRNFPKTGLIVEHNFRAFPLHRFPFHLIYKIETGEIIFIAVAHQSRRDGYWKGRV